LHQPRKTLKRETVLTLNFVKNYHVSNRKCSKTTFFKEMRNVRLASNKNNQKVVEEQEV